jgi:hypothetical protein
MSFVYLYCRLRFGFFIDCLVLYLIGIPKAIGYLFLRDEYPFWLLVYWTPLFSSLKSFGHSLHSFMILLFPMLPSEP